MKTLKQIKDELAERYYQSTFSQAKVFVPVWQLIDLMDECAKLYAEQAIEECTTVTEKESWLYNVGSTIPPGHALSNLVEKIDNIKNELK